MTLTLISHFYNEEFLLPFWILHHSNIVDHAILIDSNATDNSRRIIQELAPKHWEVRNSRNNDFDASICDQQVMDIERGITGWKVVLNTTEFLFHPRPKEYIERFKHVYPGHAIGTRAFVMV